MAKVYRVDDQDLPLDLTAPPALAAWLQQRVFSLTEELERRIEQVENLKRQLAHQRAHFEEVPGDAPGRPIALTEVYRKAAEFDAVMATRTMRTLAVSRRIYGRLLATRTARR